MVEIIRALTSSQSCRAEVTVQTAEVICLPTRTRLLRTNESRRVADFVSDAFIEKQSFTLFSFIVRPACGLVTENAISGLVD
jgi:hypothetical protein